MEKCSITNICSSAMLSILIFAVSISFFAVTATPVQSASDPVLYVDPPVYNATHLGETFQIAVTVANVAAGSHMVGAEFKLQYNETLLETREEWVSEGNFFERFGDTFFEVFIETDALSHKYIHAFVILLPSEDGTISNFPSGGGTVATISFNASYRPVAPLEGSCALRIFDTILLDFDVNTLSHTTNDGLYRIASLPVPSLMVTPTTYTAIRKGEVFDVEVNLKDVDIDWRLVGLQFQLHYDTTLLETKPEWVHAGGFFSAYGSTWFDAYVDSDHATVGVMILPTAEAVWPGPFPEGEGAIANITFKSLYQPVEPVHYSSCPLALTETILVDAEGNTVPHTTSDGLYQIPSLLMPTLEVAPNEYTALRIGEEFDVKVDIKNVDIDWHLVGLQFKLHYNATLLETKPEWVSEGGFFSAYGSTWFDAYVENDVATVGVLILPNAGGVWSGPFPQGEGTVVTLRFKSLYQPVEPVHYSSCPLALTETILVDAEGNTVPHTTSDGLYRIASLPVPTLEVAPSEYTAIRKGEVFDVEVNLKGVDIDWHLVGLQFKLHYNATLLETKPEWVSEGGFFRAYGSTWFDVYVENDVATVGVLILPSAGAVWPGPFPQGEGTVVTLRFKSLYQPLVPLDSSSCPLALDEVILVNDKGEQVPYNVNNGEFSIVAAQAGIDQYRPLDVQVDVGTIHFTGEIADFYILVTDYGKALNPDSLRAVLYFDGEEFVNLTTRLQHVAKGLYRLPFVIPADAEPGTYGLLVQAEYLQASGSAVKSFLLSSTLDEWNTEIADIADNVGTVLIPSIGQIRVDLAALNATLLRVNDRVVTIGTSLGNLTTDVSNLNVTLVRIDGNVATVQTSLGTLQGTVDSIQGDTASIKTDVGIVKVNVSDLQGSVSDLQGGSQTSTNLLYVTLVLALIAAVAAVIAVFNTFKKARALRP